MKEGGIIRSTIAMFLALMLVCCVIAFLCIGTVIFFSSAASSSSADEYHYEHVYGDVSTNKLLSISISGPILTNSETESVGFSLLSTPVATYGYQVKEKLYRAAEDENIKGIILEINSPGGTITGAKAISDGVEYYREQTGNPVIAHISGMGTSGAYWAAVAADYVLVDTGSVSGSIGVIYGPFKYYDKVLEEGGLLDGSVVTQNGIETKYFTGGQYKDNGSPYRQLTQEETEIIQQSVNNEYQTFVDYVVKRRGLSESQIKQDAKALAYGNQQALELKLVDEEASREESYANLADRAELDDYEIVRESRNLGFLGQVFSVVGSDLLPQAQQTEKEPTVCRLCAQPLYFYGNPESAF